MKLTKTKKILLLGTILAVLSASIAIPIVVLNKDENNVEKIFKILQAKTNEEKIIELSNNASGKIIANNQAKIIEKIKALIDKANLKDVKIEVSMENDNNVSTTPQKIIIKLTENEFSKEIEGFSVKRKSTPDEDIAAIKKVLESKTGNDLIIILPNSSTGNIIENRINKILIIKKIIMLIDPSNKSGEGNHQSLRGTSIQVSISSDKPISTTAQNIIVKISKTSRTTLRTTKTFQVKRDFTANEDIAAIKKVLESKTGQDLIITLPSDSTGFIYSKLTNRISIERKLRMLIDFSNINGEANHASLRGVEIFVAALQSDKIISTTPQYIDLRISKRPGRSVEILRTFRVKKA